MNSEFESLLTDFSTYLAFVTENSKSQKSYISYVKTLDKKNGGKTMDWLKDAIDQKDPIDYLSEHFDAYFSKKGIVAQPQWKTGLCKLGEYVCGFTNASVNVHSVKKFDLVACQMVAQSALFCPIEVFKKVQSGDLGAKENKGQGNKYGAWYHYTFQRARHKEKPGEYKDDTIRFDNNTHANTAIKTAILKGLNKYGLHGNSKQLFKGFEACHIWPDTCYDEHYHTSVANLVLLPREIASLTDHCKAVEDMLKYEAWKRFKFKPEGEANPVKPTFYSDITWRVTPEMKIE